MSTSRSKFGFPHGATANLDIVIVSSLIARAHEIRQRDVTIPNKPLTLQQVGASLGGLATALALKRLPPPHAHTITLLERNPSLTLANQGGGIAAEGDTLAFFTKYDATKCGLAVSSARRQYLNKNGEVVHTQNVEQSMTTWNLAYSLLRANVDGLKNAHCQDPGDDDSKAIIKHLCGHRVTGLWQRNNGNEGGRVVVEYETSNNTRASLEADLVICADGPSSTIRSIFAPDVEQAYAGYVGLHGTVREDRLSSRALETFRENFTVFHGPGVQILAYVVPGENGTLEPGQRSIGFVYYKNTKPKGMTDRSSEFRELMTDADGKYHRITVPPGKTNLKTWEKQCQIANGILPPQFAELMRSTDQPFTQAVTDVLSPNNEFLDGRVILIGDALAGFRPHTAANASQACFNAMLLADMIAGKVDRLVWKMQTLGFARTIQARGVSMGNRSQHEQLPLGELIEDHNLASVPRQGEIWPDWAIRDLD